MSTFYTLITITALSSLLTPVMIPSAPDPETSISHVLMQDKRIDMQTGIEMQTITAKQHTNLDDAFSDLEVKYNPPPKPKPKPTPPPEPEPEPEVTAPPTPTFTLPAHMPRPDPGSAKEIAYNLLDSYGWSENKEQEYSCLVLLWERESNWNYQAMNSSSGAYGIPQSLPGQKMAAAGEDWQTNPETQIRWGLGYIQSRYGNPCKGWEHSENHGWY